MPTAKSSSSNKKQTTLNFGTSKPVAASDKKANPTRKDSFKKAESSEIEDFSSSSSDEIEGIEKVEEDKEIVGKKRKRFEEKKVEGIETPSKRQELKVSDPRWRKLAANARAVNGHLPLIHAEDQNKIHDILRVFDLSYEYGPCYGMSRIDRWERAKALGLNPPLEIREILMTRQGVEDPKYSQSVFVDQAELI